MDIHHLLQKKEGPKKISTYDRALLAWVLVVVVTLAALIISIVFHTFSLLGIEDSIAAAPTPVGAAAPDTIDRTALAAIISAHDARIADFPSVKAAALASRDPSK